MATMKPRRILRTTSSRVRRVLFGLTHPGESHDTLNDRLRTAIHSLENALEFGTLAANERGDVHTAVRRLRLAHGERNHDEGRRLPLDGGDND